MKLASLKSNSRDGDLCVVSRDLKRFVEATQVASSLLVALEKWESVYAPLSNLYAELNEKSELGEPFDENLFFSCLPRAPQFVDGSAFLNHVKLVRKARNAPLPETLETVPLMYQAVSDRFLSPTEDIPQVDFSHGTDFEAEIGVIVGDTPIGVKANEALGCVRLLCLINDVSLRGLIPAELASGFGFLVSKPQSALSAVAVTPDELGSHWRDGRVHLPLQVLRNGELFGRASGSEMHFDFGRLIEHAAQTRELRAGSVVGSGTVANEDLSKGSSCIVEKRTIEQIEKCAPQTPYLKAGERVEISMLDSGGQSIFGKISQFVRALS